MPPNPPIRPSHSLPNPITPNPTKEKRLIILQPKVPPIVRQPIIAIKPPPHQLIIPRPLLPGAVEAQIQPVQILPHPLRLNKHVPLRLPDLPVGVVPRRPQPPPALVRHLHRRGRQVRARAAAVERQRLAREVVHHVGGLGHRQEGDAGAVAEEAEVAVVGHDVHGAVPGRGVRRRLAGAHVVHRGDVAAAEADAGPEAEHALPGGGVEGREVEEGGGLLLGLVAVGEFRGGEGGELLDGLLDGGGGG